MTPRTERDLRDALALAADDHPTLPDVLPSGRRRRPVLLPVAAAAAVLLAVAVPTLVLRERGSGGTAQRPAGGLATGASTAGSGGGSGGASTGVAHGPVDGPATIGNPVTVPGSGWASAGHTCRPGEVTLRLVWTVSSAGLAGTLSAKNTSTAACDLLVKPTVTVIGPDGRPVPSIASMEMKTGPQRLLPGASATAPITWTHWCGTDTAAPVTVAWGTGNVSVTPSGPRATSSCAVPPTDQAVSAGWFDPLS